MYIPLSEYNANKDNLTQIIDKYELHNIYVKDDLLSLAAMSGDIHQIDELIQMGAMYNHVGHWKRNGGEPLWHAIRTNQIEVVKHLLKKYPELVNERDYRASNSSYDGPLNAAIRIGNCEMIELILDFGADINYYSMDEETSCSPALYVAITAGEFDNEHPNINVVKLLIKRGASQDISYMNSEMLFSFVYDEEIMKFLLSKDFVPTPKDIENIIHENAYWCEDDDDAKMISLRKMRHDLLVVHGYITNHLYSNYVVEVFRDRFYPLQRFYDIIIMHVDKYHVVKNGNEQIKRFFMICDRLPGDLQLVMANVVFGRTNKSVIF